MRAELPVGGRVGRLRRANAELACETDALAGRLAALVALGRSVQADGVVSTRCALAQGLIDLRARAAAAYPLHHQPWDHPGWAGWMPADDRPGTAIAIGQLREVRSGQMLGIPALADLGRPIVIRSRPGQEQAAAGLLQALVVRSAVVLGGAVRYRLIDLRGPFGALGMTAPVPGLEPTTGDPLSDLEPVMAEIRRGIAAGAGPAAHADATRRVIAVAHFPAGWDRPAIQALRMVCRSGPMLGTHAIIHHHVDRVTSGVEEVDLESDGAQVVDLAAPAAGAFVAAVLPGAGTALPDVDVVFDSLPKPAVVSHVLARVAEAPRRDTTLHWDDLDHPAREHWWTGDATHRISAPVGRRAIKGILEVVFGVDGEDRPCAHGVVVAMTGAGKTALFHGLIASLAIRYSPAELRLHLLDGKAGVGFAGYRHLPHAAVISLRTRPDLARGVLDDLIEEMVRRNELFKRHHVEHFAAYRALGSPEGRLPRVLMIADEFQLLFEDDRQGHAATALLRLSEQSRSAGIHLLLGSQHFAPAGMTSRNLIFANIHLRMALQMAAAEVKACGDFGPDGRRLIETTCTGTGRLVLNDRAGDDAANCAGTVAYLDDARRGELLTALSHIAPGVPAGAGAGSSALPGFRTGPLGPVVLDGDGQPDLADNPLLGSLTTATGPWPSNDSLSDLAALGHGEGGFGCPDWVASEGPWAALLGQAFAVRGQAVAVLRRRQHDHLCVIGEAHLERVALLCATVASACLQLPPAALRLMVADLSTPGAGWSGVLRKLAERARAVGYPTSRADGASGAADLIRAAFDELGRRRRLCEADRARQPAVLVVLAEPDRVPALSRIPDDFGFEESELGSIFGILVSEGAPLGIHVVAGFTTLGAVRTVMSDRRLQAGFRHRVAMQMSDDDSFIVVNSPAAARLQLEGPRPVAAVLFEPQAGRSLRFKPYTLGSRQRPGSLLAVVDDVFDLLAMRAEKVTS